jgi:uncharacterized protein (DUF2267 family)
MPPPDPSQEESRMPDPQSDDPPTTTTTTAAADRLLAKLRSFADALDPEERRALAALLAPGVDAAWRDDPEVEAFGVEWRADRLPAHLTAAIRARDLRIEGG